MSLIEKLNWRYATKKFDHTKKLSQAQLDELLKAVHLSPSSSGLQSYKMLVVKDPAIRQKLREAAHGQPQLTDASQIIIFASETNLDAAYVKKYIDHIAKTRQIARESLEGFEQAINGNISKLTAEQKIEWSHKQTYIALGVLLTAAADMGIDSCPMEGFNTAKFDEILGLNEKGLTTSVIAAIGFRSADDEFSKFIKVRKPNEEMFIHI
ncbi:MAG: NAD(P)H-dependent oxidoreductase [Mucilaginibacter sp.]|nr:NAD(P)H-dependent oxidoreductase [Mucilaginibacter sp.]